jgi:predicted O-linked N-acetylglucosamine transferase (SPINDLY family)
MMATLAEALAVAVTHHQGGRLELAEELYRRILAAAPEHAEAWHLWGVVALQRGQFPLAVERVQQAIALRPHAAAYYNNLGGALQKLGRLDEAIAAFRRATELAPDLAEPHHHLGQALREQHQLDEARACFQRAVELRPDFLEALGCLATTLREQGQLDAAVACYERALRLRPHLAETHNNLANAWRDQGRRDAAIAGYRRALELKPDYAEAHYNLGKALDAAGKPVEAVPCFRRAIELQPSFARAFAGLGAALQRQGQLGEAMQCYERALALEPNLIEALYSRGTAAIEMAQLDLAIASFRRVLELAPDMREAENNLGIAWLACGDAEEAVRCFARVVAAEDASPAVHSNLLLARSYCADASLQTMQAAYAEFERRYAAPLRARWRPHANPRDTERPLRLGLVSGDFARHPVGYLYLNAVEHLQRQGWHLTCYSDRLWIDAITARFRAAASDWQEVATLSDEQLAEKIRADRIDLLFDLASHAAGNRLLAFARRPAPIQIAWAGPVGLEAMDYLLADRYLLPPEAEPQYRETVLRMPDAYACYGPPGDTPAVGPLPALARGRITLGCLNNLAKVTPHVLATWAEILRALPTARLLFRYGSTALNPGTRDRLLEAFTAQGVAPQQIEVAGWAAYERQLEIYNEIDLALDPFPFSGCTVTCEALWMGVPVVTCPGDTFFGRQSLTWLKNLGLDELVAADRTEYVRRAVALAQDLPRLAALRAELRPRMAASPLCDGERFAHNLTSLLHAVWRRWCCEPPRRAEESGPE